jgi:monoamine oxidase
MATTSAFATGPGGGVNVDAQNGLAQLAAVFPGISAKWNGKATQSLPHKSSLSNGSYSYYRVGQYTDFGGYERVRQGGVLFCGEHTSTDFQGFMEGGASEGKRAAAELDKLI